LAYSWYLRDLWILRFCGLWVLQGFLGFVDMKSEGMRVEARKVSTSICMKRALQLDDEHYGEFFHEVACHIEQWI
jgi:hypothetical protein